MHQMTRKHYIPISRHQLKTALRSSGMIEPENDNAFLNLWNIIEAYYQNAQFRQCETLRSLYYPLDPEIADDDALGSIAYTTAFQQFFAAFKPLLERANFESLTEDLLPDAATKESESGLIIYAPESLYSDVRFYCRGRSEERQTVSRFFGLKKTSRLQPAYETVIMIAAIKSESEFESKRQIKKLRENNIHPGSVFIKLYRHVNHNFLRALLPDVRLKFDTRNKLALGIPALIGGIPLMFKILPTLAVLSIFIGIQLPFISASDHDDTEQIIAALAGAFAAGGFISHQFLKFQRHSLKYMSKIKNQLFYKNSSNNAGLFDYLALLANEQEIKECMLAYCFLHHHQDQTEMALDEKIETWLTSTLHQNIDFESDDAIRKLIALNLVSRNDQVLRVRPLQDAVAIMHDALSALLLNHHAPDISTASATG